MTTSAKATCTWQGVWVTIPVTYFQRVVSAPIDLPPTENGQTLRIRSVPYAFTERNASTTPNAALKSWWALTVTIRRIPLVRRVFYL